MTTKQYKLNGWAKLCQDGFTMTQIMGPNNWTEQVTDNNKIVIHLGTNFKPKECVYEYESNNGFTLRKIYGLMNDTYFRYCDEKYEGNYDYLTEMAIDGFDLVDETHVYCSYST